MSPEKQWHAAYKLDARYCLGLYAEFEYRHHVIPSQQTIKDSNTKLEEIMQKKSWCKVKRVLLAGHVGKKKLDPRQRRD
jgi:hypothetical protein